MWVYDGENWINEGGSSEEPKTPSRPHEYQEFYPELQVVEVEVPLRKERPIPFIPTLIP